MEILLDKHVHHLPQEELLLLLETSGDKGLDILEAKARQERFGPNLIPAEAKVGGIVLFLLQFHQPLIYILLAAAAITAALQEWVDAGVIFGVVLVNAVIGYLQEAKAARALDALAKTTVTAARVVRGGETRTIPSVDLVPGDLVLLQSGDKVPADLRLIRCRDLQIDESALTGESVPVEKTAQLLAKDTPLAERRNQAFTSTLVSYGQAAGVVVAIGAATEVGRISHLLSTADVLETPLTRKIEGFSKLLLVAILVLAAITFGVGLARGESAFDMFMASVALAVGAIPEGLPAVVTITLAIGVARMAQRRAIIRKLPAVETLGSTTTICSDKTGTLTVNQMTVRSVWAGGKIYQVSGTGYDPVGGFRSGNVEDDLGDLDAQHALRECLLAGLACNDSSLVDKEGRLDVDGDPTEGALLVSAAKAGLDRKEWNARLPRIDSIPFESQHKYMATLHRKGPDGNVVFVKGAVEVLAARCTGALASDGSQAPFDPEVVMREFESLAAQGLRVLGFVRADLPPDKDRIEHADLHDLTFLGLQGMIDPPRPEAIAAVAACHGAGMMVKMITGDHALTARAIARQLGLSGRDDDDIGPRALSGRELEDLSDTDLIQAVEEVAVFARVSPEQKLRLVRALQARGQVVAMTGDGVNDAPALRQADIGVAMGRGGTEVAKEAADMVLTDDNFATIEAAVEEGRGVFDNLVKFIVWTLPTNLGEGLVILAAVFTGAVLPILPVQILWINMTTAVLLGMMLAFEPKEKDIMRRPPRDPEVPILTGPLLLRMGMVGLIMLLGAFGSFAWSLERMRSLGFDEIAAEATARTVAVNVFVMVEIFYLFNCRSLTKSMFGLGVFTNPWVLVGSGIMILLQLLFTYAPFMNRLFHTAPIGWDAWWRILLTALGTYLAVGLEKWLRRWWKQRNAISA